jgi:hypothetical protein
MAHGFAPTCEKQGEISFVNNYWTLANFVISVKIGTLAEDFLSWQFQRYHQPFYLG